jgi:hypothetical protein
MQTIETTSALDRIEKFFTGYISPEYSTKRLQFISGGQARFGSVVGFIMGVKLAGSEEKAEQLAEQFLDRMDYLAKYGGETEIDYLGETLKVPSYVVRIADDGLPHSFSLAWYGKPRVVRYNTPLEDCTIDVGSFPVVRYSYAFNGGLIYHGFRNETYSVRVGDDSNPWGIHT